MPRSSRCRNGLLISGVVISHVLVILSLLSMSLSGNGLTSPGALTVNLIGERAKSSLPQKSLATTQANTSFGGARISSSANHELPNLGGGGEGVHLDEAPVRQAIHSPKPRYPLLSKQLREQGLLLARLCVNKEGLVQEVGITKSSGFEGLDRSALNALAQWRFAPITENSMSLSSQCFQTPIQFTLEG